VTDTTLVRDLSREDRGALHTLTMTWPWPEGEQRPNLKAAFEDVTRRIKGARVARVTFDHLTKLERTAVVAALRQHIDRASKRRPTWAYLAAIRALLR
jgi:hypothetical protein